MCLLAVKIESANLKLDLKQKNIAQNLRLISKKEIWHWEMAK